MIGRRPPFGTGELPAGESAGALSASLALGRELEALAGAATAPLAGGFVDDVMAAIALEPAPQPVVLAGRALRAGRPLALVAAVADAWRVAFGGGRPGIVRAPALALVIVTLVAVGSIATIGGYGVASALGLGEDAPPPVQLPPVQLPSPSPSQTATPTLPPSPSPSPSPSATPSPSPVATPTPSSSPTGTPDAAASDHELETETPSPGDGSDGSGSGSGNSGRGSDSSGSGSSGSSGGNSGSGSGRS